MTALAFPKANNLDIDALSALPTVWVDTKDTLCALIEDIKSVNAVALDTEFIKRTTYYPILALVQVNTGNAIYLVDAPRLELDNFWQALTQVPTMVWYACGEDLGIFYLLAKNPPLLNVFDAQIGLAYLTGKLQAGYSQAVQEVLGITLDKGESQSDWLNRPLTNKQKTYALNDVRYLLALYDTIKHHLDNKNLYSCVLEDCTLYAKELHTSQTMTDDERYLEFITPIYNQKQLAVLQGLVSWRESLARTNNEPRSFIIGKQALREIVLLMPESIKSLAGTTINRHALRRYGHQIINIIRHAKNLPADDRPTLPPPVYSSKNKPFKKALDKAITNYSKQKQIPSNLLMRGRWIDQLLYMVYQDLPPHMLPDGLKGYRYQWIIDTVLPLLQSYKTQIQDGFTCTLMMQQAD